MSDQVDSPVQVTASGSGEPARRISETLIQPLPVTVVLAALTDVLLAGDETAKVTEGMAALIWVRAYAARGVRSDHVHQQEGAASQRRQTLG